VQSPELEQGKLAQMLAGMMPMGPPCHLDDLAKAILFLTPDLASYVNGTSLRVDGAHILR
jgi:NAD(P)-dependent dehydrogenase (short-subunit alcohol dehydrogenase family)